MSLMSSNEDYTQSRMSQGKNEEDAPLTQDELLQVCLGKVKTGMMKTMKRNNHGRPSPCTG